MSGYKRLIMEIGACVVNATFGRLRIRTGQGVRWYRSTSILTGALFVLLGAGTIAKAAVNVYLAPGVPVSLQADVLAGLTNQWNGPLVQSKFDPTTYSFTITSKRPVPAPGNCPICLVDVSSEPYAYGFVSGQEYTRNEAISLINTEAVACSTTTTCNQGLSKASADLWLLNFSTPTVIVPPGQ